MKPDENQNAASEPTSGSLTETPLEQRPDSSTQPTITDPTPINELQKPRKKHFVFIGIVAIELLILPFAHYIPVVFFHSSAVKPTAANTLPWSVPKNSWTGKDNNYNWNDANNWTLGVPKNNQTLEINIANVKQPKDGTQFSFQDNIPNLTIDELVINGQAINGVGFDIKGSPLTVTDGILVTATTSNDVSYSTEIQIDNQINLGADATIQTIGHNALTFYSDSNSEVINLASNTVRFAASDNSQINVSGAIAGTGEVLLANNAVSSHGGVIFGTSSPNFNGNVLIGSGDSVSVGNLDNGGYGKVDAFGNSSIDILDGGAMVVFATGTTNFNINNSITVSGNGITNSDGSVTGAVSACVTSAQEGCGPIENIKFSSQVKLQGNTQIGESTPSSLGADNTHVNYTFNTLDKNGYSLNTITNYYYSAKF